MPGIVRSIKAIHLTRQGIVFRNRATIIDRHVGKERPIARGRISHRVDRRDGNSRVVGECDFHRAIVAHIIDKQARKDFSHVIALLGATRVRTHDRTVCLCTVARGVGIVKWFVIQLDCQI